MTRPRADRRLVLIVSVEAPEQGYQRLVDLPKQMYGVDRWKRLKHRH